MTLSVIEGHRQWHCFTEHILFFVSVNLKNHGQRQRIKTTSASS